MFVLIKCEIAVKCSYKITILFLLEKKLFLVPCSCHIISNKKVLFSGSKIYVQAQAFDSLMESLSSGVDVFVR